MTPADFFRANLENARRVSKRTGIDPRLVLAQTALETGYGRSAPNNNFFGIKGPGRTLQTQEFRDGQMRTEDASFRSYENPAQSFDDYASLMLRSSRYEPVRAAQGLEAQIAAMAASGYATDPNYGQKLMSIASKIDLDDPSVIADDAMPAVGKQPLGVKPQSRRGILAPTETAEMETEPMMQQQPRGLLGRLGVQKMREGAEGETGQRFFERESFKDTAATLAQGFAAMGGNPNLQKFAADVAGQRSEAKARNKTAEYLKANGMEDIAELMLAGQIGAREVGAALVQRRLEKPKDDRTALMKNYEFAKQTGYEGSFNDFLRSGGAGGSVVNVGGNQVQRVGDFAVIPDEASEAGVRFVPIPGSKAAQEAQAGEQRKEAAAGQAAQKETVVSGSIDYMLDKIEGGGLFDLPEAGVAGNILGRLGVNQEAVDFRNELATVQANIAFDRLQQMREASKTGGALGAVSERELDLLMNAYGNINQSTSPNRLAENLRTIKDIMTKIENDPVASSFYYGNSAATGSTAQPQSGGVTVGDPY